MPARPRWIVAFIAAAVLTLGCGELPDPAMPDDSAPPPSAAPTQSGEPDGTATVEEFNRDARGAVSGAETYWSGVFKSSGVAFTPVRTVTPYRGDGELSCGREPIPADNAVYCPAGDFIAYDADWAVTAFRKIGDAFVYYLLGHEYAHAVQARLGVEHRYAIDHELQADCMAGAYLGDSVRDDKLQLADGDLEEFRSGLLAVGDPEGQPWFAPESHGTVAQRTDAFFSGYEKSLDACDLT
ncbi:neutral zinc metallopeptidase [Catellatospora vulcania]|uniref:neutral zinc metallopeptidase n=1 Tax=Catellatospora vulcania TaxID=1460450 RepID=UPI0012D4283A|nr:neutral zinc metallopeptidase [Catellatospora vulcania]